jgi:serine/threonine protein kinase
MSGTLQFRAPEMLLGDESYGLAVDVWALGTFYGELRLRVPAGSNPRST